MTHFNGRQICIWRGRDPYEDLNSLADAIAQTGEVFDHNGQLVWLNAGSLIPVSGAVLRGIIGRRVVTRRLVNHGTPAEPNWVCEYLPFVPNEMALRMLLNAENPKEGSLLARAPRRPRSGVLLIARATDDGTTAATNRKTKIPPAREFLAHTDFLHELSIRYPLPLGHPVGGMSIPSPRGPSALTAVSQHDGSAL